jgi:hypothetical protein
MPRLLRMGLVSLALLSHGIPPEAPEVGLPNLVLELASDSLRDVAVAVYAPYRGLIYYNPSRERELGPDLAAFFRAHEFGHLYYHHTRAGAMAGASSSEVSALLQARELEADCYATVTLARSRRAAVDAAYRFFLLMGPVRLDSEHPDGTARAENIRNCSVRRRNGSSAGVARGQAGVWAFQPPAD